MKDQAGRTLKAHWKGELYHVGTINTLEGKVQIASPVKEDETKAYFVKVVKLKDVTLVLE